MFMNLWGHVLRRAADRCRKIFFLKVTFTHTKVTDTKMPLEINENILGFKVSVENFFLVNVLHGKNDLTEVVFDMFGCHSLSLRS